LLDNGATAKCDDVVHRREVLDAVGAQDNRRPSPSEDSACSKDILENLLLSVGVQTTEDIVQHQQIGL
jgi:hypothetical protein